MAGAPVEEKDRGPWLIAEGVLVVLGVLLRVFQWWSGRSLWLDEVMLARNILDRPLARLIGVPLDSNQVAPSGFLLRRSS